MKTIHAAVAAIALGVITPGHATLLQNDGTRDFALAYQVSATFASMFAWNSTPDSEVPNADRGRQSADPVAPFAGTPSVDGGPGAELRIAQRTASTVAPTTAAGIGPVDPLPTFAGVTALESFATPTAGATANRSGDGSEPAIDIGATALPEPGLLQLMGLGMVALATVAGTRSRIADREAV